MISVSGNVDGCGSPYLHKVEKLVRVVRETGSCLKTPVVSLLGPRRSPS